MLHGIVKIASKMGVSTLQSYQSSQIFEAVGIGRDVIDQYFTNTVSTSAGSAWTTSPPTWTACTARRSTRWGWTPTCPWTARARTGCARGRGAPVQSSDHPSAAGGYPPGRLRLFKQYTALINDETKVKNLRGLLDFKFPEQGIPLDEVESAVSIVKRFKTGAMSYGSISQEAHETLAIAMNTLGGKSNSGEGGEARERLTVGSDGLDRCSAIKQVASGRFGVTSEYLNVRQGHPDQNGAGAKPGEGAICPAARSTPWWPRTPLHHRVTLISRRPTMTSIHRGPGPAHYD